MNTNQLLKEVILRITTKVESNNLDRYDLAKELYWAYNAIVWKMTDYGSWAGFCKLYVKLAPSTIHSYISNVSLVNKFKYTDAQIVQIIKAIGWTNFTVGIHRITRKLTVKTFITRFQSVSSDGGKWKEAEPGSDRGYTYSLPAEIADILDPYLISYGMHTNPETGRRTGVRTAMITLIETHLK